MWADVGGRWKITVEVAAGDLAGQLGRSVVQFSELYQQRREAGGVREARNDADAAGNVAERAVHVR